MSDVRVEELCLYPVKSAQGISVDRASAAETGLEYRGIRDREFMIVDATDNGFLTQRTVPELARIEPLVRDDDDYMRLSVEGWGLIEVPVEYDADAPLVNTAVHGKPCAGRDVGEMHAEFLSDYLHRSVRLIRESREHPRFVGEPYQRPGATNRVAFGDGFPLLLASRASLHELHNEQGLRYGAVPMNRFRPNVVVDGMDLEPFAEDAWDEVRIGRLSAFVVRACARCTIPSIVQTGEQAGRPGDIAVTTDFLRVRKGIDLASPEKSRGRFFGQNMVHVLADTVQTVSVGDAVTAPQAYEPNIELTAA